MRYANFNPRSREGSDYQPNGDACGGNHFNPRSREGSDGTPASISGAGGYFNPRSREGSDPFGQFTAHLFHISIHAPAKGATVDPVTGQPMVDEFQSTLPRRERLLQYPGRGLLH